MPSIIHRIKLLATASLGAAALAGGAQAASTATDAVAALQAQGYSAIYDLKLQHGHWSAEATTQQGVRVQLLLDAFDQLVEVGNPATQHHLASAQQVVQYLQTLGYQNVRDVELDDGFWEAEALNRDGFEVDLVLHPVTLELLAEVIDGLGDATSGVGSDLLSAADIRASLEAAGYGSIRDLEFDDGFWEADAVNAAGQQVELTIDPRSGAVVREQLDD